MEKKIKHSRDIQDFFLPTKFCGESTKEKTTKNIFSYLAKEKADYIFTQNSESIAWLFNMRGLIFLILH